MLKTLLAALLAACPAFAEGGRALSAPAAIPTLSLPAAPVAPLNSGPALALPAAPALGPAPQLQTPALPTLPALAPQAAAPAGPGIFAPERKSQAVPEGRAPLPQRLAAMGRAVDQADESLSNGADPRAAGQSLERLLTGEKGFAAPGDAAVPAGAGSDGGQARQPEAAAHAADAVTSLVGAAEDLIAGRELKASAMSGPQFATIVREAARAQDAARADPAASTVRAQVVRVVTALMPADKTAKESLPRLVSVLQVMHQELRARADEQSTVSAVLEDAELFASQVEASVPSAPRAPPQPALPAQPATPEDPEGLAASAQPGSVFGWQPIELSPDHGLPALDRAIRGALSLKPSPYAAGFEIPGAPSREGARVFFYGEKHTDGPLIAANMARLVEDTRKDKPAIVLVEGYTGRELRGWQALEYLSKRGLDYQALAAKDVGAVSVRGWDTPERYDASKRPLLQHHMDQLELNRLAFGEKRGAAYYRSMARAGRAALQSRRELWQKAIVARNADLDAAVAAAVREADETGATVHVIAGTDHLMETPRLNAAVGVVAAPRFRRSLRAALGDRPFWASQPANTPEPLRLVIMGPPASGKGTMAQRLARDYGVVHVSAGELLREYAKDHPDVAETMKRGDLVPASLVVGLVRDRIMRPDAQKRGFLLDGFPRRLEEARALRDMLIAQNVVLDAAIKLDAPQSALLARVLARGRADDTEATFRNRMKVYQRDTVPAMAEISRGTTVVAPRLRDPSASADAHYAELQRLLDARQAPAWWRRALGRLTRLLGF